MFSTTQEREVSDTDDVDGVNCGAPLCEDYL